MDWKIELLVVPVADVERAKRFYNEQLGFNVDHDTQATPTIRIVQLTPPGSACSIAIGDGLIKTAPGSAQGMQIVVEDIQKARQQLVDRGVDASPVRHIENGEWLDGPGGPWNSFVFFSDPDGNGWAIQEKPR
jgi:catechol 2,3-dioxygenase-like lactoylglutathione lyase family enzyme